MDNNKKSILMLWIGKVWGKPINTISELGDGRFFLHVLRTLSHCSQQVSDLDEADVEAIFMTVKRCLQDIYSTDDFNGILDFESVFSDIPSKKEFELAKIALVLLGVALIDKQGGDIVQKASMELPAHLHTGVVSLLEAVVQRHHGPNLMLTSAIEEALKTSLEKQGDIALESWFQMPKYECIKSQDCKNVSSTSLPADDSSDLPQAKMSTPLSQCRKGSSASTPLNTSFGISSPFRELNINSVSPFVSYIQSPQLIRKAVYNEKELELRQLKARLNEEILLKEDVQLSLRDQIQESTKKESEIGELKNRIRELQLLQDAYDELQELKPRHAELEAKCDKFLSRQQKLDQYKSECRMLEKESTSQRDEIQALLQEIQSLKNQNQEKSDMLKTKNSVEKQMSLLKVQLEESARMKTLMEEELMSTRSNLQMTEEKLKELKKLTEECNDESFQGESMGVITDIQLGEMKTQVDRLMQERDDLQSEICCLKSSLEEQSSFVEEMKKQMESSQQTNEGLVSQLRNKCSDIDSLKSNMADKESDHKNALAVLKGKHEDDLKAVHLESEKRVLSLVEGHEVSIKRLQTAAEKVSIEKDSILQEVKDLEKKMILLQEKHTKEIDVLKAESEKELSSLNRKLEQDLFDQQKNEEMRRNEIITEHEQQTQALRDISEEKLLLQKEEQEIQLLKVKEELLCEMKSQKSEHENQMTELKELNDKHLCEKNELEKEIESVRSEARSTLESEKSRFDSEIQKLKEEKHDEINDIKSKCEIKLSSFQGDSESQIRSLVDELANLRQENTLSRELLRKEHENSIFELNEKMASTVQQYEKEVDDLQKKIQDTEEQKAKLENHLVKLQEATTSSMDDLHNRHNSEMSTLQQENNSNLLHMEQEHKQKIEQLEIQAQETLNKQKGEMQGVITQLRSEYDLLSSQKVTGDQEISSLITKNAELKEQLATQESEMSEMSIEKSIEKLAVEEKVKALEKENAHLLKLKTSWELDFVSVQDENQALRTQVEEATLEINDYDKMSVEMTSEITGLEATISNLHKDNGELSHKCKGLEEHLSTLQSQHSELVSSKELTGETLRALSQEKSEIMLRLETAEASVVKIQQENAELMSQKAAVNTELSVVQHNLEDISMQRSSLEKELTTVRLEKSDVLSQKTFIEEELSCLKQENTEVLSQRNRLEENVTNLHQKISEMASLKANVEENYSVKERDNVELKSEISCVQEKLMKLQEEASLSHRSLTEKYDADLTLLKKESEEKVCSLIENHQSEVSQMKEEKAVLMEEIATLKDHLDLATTEARQIETVMTENEKLAENFKKETLEKLEQERSTHEEHFCKIQREWEERLSFEKAELEQLIVNDMKEELDVKVSLMKNEYNELAVKLQEASDALAYEKEEHGKAMTKVVEEAETKITAEKTECERLLVCKENEFVEKLALEKDEREKLFLKASEEKSAQEQLISRIQEEATAALMLEKEVVERLRGEFGAVDAERLELTKKIATLQEETTKMMQLQKGEHEREMQDVRASSEAKILEVTARCHKEVEALRSELEENSNRHDVQLEEEIAKVRRDTEISYESSLDELKVKFEAAKELELKTFSDQKAEFSALKEQHEAEAKSQQAKLKELQEENTRLRERETAVLKNMETQMSTANEFCNNLRQQLEAANSKLEASPSREKLKLYEQQLMKQKETNARLNNALQIEKETSSKMQQRLETHITKHEKTKALLENAHKESRVYAIENNRLKTSLDYSERKLKSYKQQLEQAGSALLGSDANFKRTIEEQDAEMDDSLDANTSVVSSYSLRSVTSTGSIKSRGSAKSDEGSPNETIISADSVMMRRETLAGASDLRKKVPPPGFKANMLSCDNEPEEFEWDRLSELKRRNTLCLPHMKSSYPVETQTKKEEGSDEQAVRLSMMPGDVHNYSIKHGKRRSPRLSMMHLDEEDKSLCPNKKGKEEACGGTTIYFPLVPDGAVYQPPSAMSTRSTDKQKLVASGTARKKLTPSKLTKSPGKLVTKGRSYKSPGVRGRSPAHARNNDHENKAHASVAFSIGFTPKKAGVGRSRVIQKKPTNQEPTPMSDMKLRSSPRQKVRKPLATRNFRETGI